MRFLLLLLVSISIASCVQDPVKKSLPKLMEIPIGFPSINFPEENEFSLERWELGKQLFYDPILSVDSTLSCASCHQPELAFSDDVAFSDGVMGTIGVRNSPSIANVAYHPYYTREGGVSTLETQVLVPIQEHNEFNFNIVLIAERLNQIPNYVDQSMNAYDRKPDPYVITRAISNFERSLLSGNSPYDQYIQNDKEALNDQEIRGMNLFFSDHTQCSSCHSDFNFTNYAFQNNGLYNEYEDVGRFRLTNDSNDIALFKTPSIRNIALTAPYMHDGSIQTLEEVVEHYNAGGKNHKHQDKRVKQLHLTKTEQNDLVQFLKSLTDHTFIKNPIFSN